MADFSMSAPAGGVECSPVFKEDLGLYVDGELAAARQAGLFAHLSVCPSCRHEFDGLLKFRGVVRLEHLALPAGCDDQFMKRLSGFQQQARAHQPREERTSLWQVRRFVRVRTAVLALALMFGCGFLLSVLSETPLRQAPVPARLQPRAESILEAASPVYVIYPGLTVEDSR